MSTLQRVGIEIGQNVYSTFEAQANTVSHVLAEFIDNAIQSFRDHKEELLSLNRGFQLHVDINIDWGFDNDARAKRFTIKDNAAGIYADRYVDAFKPANPQTKPISSESLNEFGMGLKTAACWLGNEWTVTINLHEVTKNNLLELPVFSTPKNKGEHYTTIEIVEVTLNAPQRKSFGKIKEELASIYRQFLRSGELCLSFCGEDVVFKECEILNAPFVNTPEADPIHWKKTIDFRFGKYRAKGFIALLKTMSSTQNRIVLLRRGRVILGADTDGHYYSKDISGQSGSPRDKRIFGELELEGFDVTFNKNGLRDKENLEALFKALVSEIHSRDFDLVTQAQNYREDELRKAVNKLVKKHDNHPRNDKQPIKIEAKPQQKKENEPQPKDENILNTYEDSYLIDGDMYKLKVTFVHDTHVSDLFWLDISKCEQQILMCNINIAHPYFKHFGKPTEALIAIFKTLAIAKFTTRQSGNDNVADLFHNFNAYIEHIKV
jgi:hypothetical protein